MYTLEYLPIAMQDMVDIASYISHGLQNPVAAEKLSTELIESAEKLVNFPYINGLYQAIKPLHMEYRKQIVSNYSLFYWVDEKEKKITIARVIYARRDYEKLL